MTIPKTCEEAARTYCPFTFEGEKAQYCRVGMCMAWSVVHPEESREDHSGGRDIILSRAVETHRIMRREGPPMSGGKFILDEVGVCARLEPADPMYVIQGDNKPFDIGEFIDRNN